MLQLLIIIAGLIYLGYIITKKWRDCLEDDDINDENDEYYRNF